MFTLIKSDILRLLKSYIRNQSATIVIAFAITAPIVVGSAGMALDMARAYLVKERLTHALDAAALAATASAAQGADLGVRLQKFFDANYPPEKLGATYDLNYELVGDDVKVSAKAKYATSFLSILGYDFIDVGVTTIVRREVRGLEVALVLDVTGSMSGSKITSLRTATLNFIDILFDRVSNHNYLKVGLVPYSITVNVGDIAPDIVSAPMVPGRPAAHYDPDSSTDWAGCVMARDGEHDQIDSDVFDGGYWDAYWWEHKVGNPDDGNGHNPWDSDQGGSINLKYPPTSDSQGCNDRRSPNLGCPIENPIVPLTSDEGVLVDAAEKLTHWCRGGTSGNLGMSWGWRVLSPSEPFTQGASYDSSYWRKAVVMMTDGENTFYQSDYSSYGYVADGNMETTEGVDPDRYGYNPTPGQSITNKSQATNEANNRFIRTCNMMKDLGITVYTVTFGSGIIGKPTEKFYKDCASDETKYFPAATNSELIDAFEQISRELSNLHIRG